MHETGLGLLLVSKKPRGDLCQGVPNITEGTQAFIKLSILRLIMMFVDTERGNNPSK